MLIGLLLAVALVQTRASAPAVARQRADLDARIAAQTAANDRATHQVAALQAQVDALKAAELAAGGQGDTVAAQLAALELQAGLVDVSGPAVQVTMDDAAAAAGRNRPERRTGSSTATCSRWSTGCGRPAPRRSP